MNQSQLTRPLHSLTIGGCLTLAKCWRLTRTDGVIIRFTDHAVEITLGGEVYSPVGGFAASAEEGTDGLTPSDRELQGILMSSEKITEDDLRAGRYHGATLEEFIVDWIMPDTGFYRHSIYTIEETSFDREMWVAQIQGPLGRLNVTKGHTYERDCRVENFGDTQCTKDLGPLTATGRKITSIVTPRKEFQTDIPTGNGDDFYNLGKVSYSGGANDGLISDVKLYVELNGVVRIQTETPFDLAVNDVFDIVPGCNRQFSQCVIYDNKDNFRGFKDIPGDDAVLSTPDALPA